jgi:hypothetical protein
LPGSEQARAMTAGSGRTCAGLLRLQGRVGFLARMCLASSRWASTVCWLTWKAKATPSGRLLCRLVPKTPDTGANECGLWPTMRAPKYGADMGKMERENRTVPTDLETAVFMWPTPRAAERSQRNSSDNAVSLGYAVKMFPTPDAGAAKGRGAGSAEQRSRLGGSLNPAWVEWLMGYPVGWTDCGASATPSSRKSRRK